MLTLLLLTLAATDVQALIDAAPAGAVVELPPGELAGEVIIRRAITLRGAGAGRTVLRGKAQEATVRILADEGTVRLEDLSITGGRSLIGGGVDHRGRAELIIEDAELAENYGATGGALHSIASRVVLRKVVMRNNRAMLGACAVLSGDHPIIIEDSDCADNRAQGVGGLVAAGRHVELRKLRFAGNKSDDGDAANLSLGCNRELDCAVTLDRVTFDGSLVASGTKIENAMNKPKVTALGTTWQ